MTATDSLERRYRRWLVVYPKEFRRTHEAEVLGVLLAGADDERRAPRPVECLDLVLGGLRMRLRLPRSNRSAVLAARLMYVGAALEGVTAIVVVVTMGQVRFAIVARDPTYTDAQWHAEVAESLRPLVAAAVVAAGLCWSLAWAQSKGYPWARSAFSLFFGVTTYSLCNGLVHGSGSYARADLVAGVLLWLVQLVAVVLLFHPEIRQAAVRRAGPG
jgi:hypothetical protein